MADKTRTYLATDWSIWTFVPQANSFVLDFSKLDGADTLGTSTGSMQVLTAGITSIQVQEGGQSSFGVIPIISVPTLTANLLLKNFTIADTKAFYIGQPIWLTLKNEQTAVDIVYGKNTPVFIGIINDFSVNVVPGDDFTQVTLFAAAVAQDELNTQLRVTKNTTDPKDLVLYNSGQANTPIVNFLATGSSINHYADTSVETKSLGDWLDDLAITDQCFFGTKQVPVILSGTNFDYSFGLYPIYPVAETVLNTLSETVISDIVIGWDCNEAPTAVELINYKTPATIVQQQVGVGTNNRTSFTQTIDVKDLTEMSAIATKLLSVSKELRPVQVTVKIAENYQTITFKESFIGTSEWLWPANYYQIGKAVKIDLPDFGISSQKTSIIGRTINIDQEQVLVTYELTKGFIY